jgi:hypothetical protein
MIHPTIADPFDRCPAIYEPTLLADPMTGPNTSTFSFNSALHKIFHWKKELDYDLFGYFSTSLHYTFTRANTVLANIGQSYKATSRPSTTNAAWRRPFD